MQQCPATAVSISVAVPRLLLADSLRWLVEEHRGPRAGASILRALRDAPEHLPAWGHVVESQGPPRPGARGRSGSRDRGAGDHPEIAADRIRSPCSIPGHTPGPAVWFSGVACLDPPRWPADADEAPARVRALAGGSCRAVSGAARGRTGKVRAREWSILVDATWTCLAGACSWWIGQRRSGAGHDAAARPSPGSEAPSGPEPARNALGRCPGVIMPCFHERATVDGILKRVLERPTVAEVIGVDDVSHDGMW